MQLEMGQHAGPDSVTSVTSRWASLKVNVWLLFRGGRYHVTLALPASHHAVCTVCYVYVCLHGMQAVMMMMMFVSTDLICYARPR